RAPWQATHPRRRARSRRNAGVRSGVSNRLDPTGVLVEIPVPLRVVRRAPPGKGRRVSLLLAAWAPSERVLSTRRVGHDHTPLCSGATRPASRRDPYRTPSSSHNGRTLVRTLSGQRAGTCAAPCAVAMENTMPTPRRRITVTLDADTNANDAPRRTWL